MNSGNASGDHKCTGTYAYTYMVSTTRKHRMCRWCSAVLSNGNVEMFLKDYVPPTTSTRKLSGITLWISATDGATRVFTDDSKSTKTLQESVTMAASGCGKSG